MIDAIQGKPVSIRGLAKTYGKLRVLDDVTLDIAAGEFCTLLGASGSGKTTLLKIIAGFETADTGRIEIAGSDIGPVPIAARNIGMVFQNYALFPHMSVRRNVAFGLEMRRLGRPETGARVAEVLELVGLTDFADRLPQQLSGGQQQRVALARALVIRPDILLMDEPLGALDKNLRQSIQLQLKALHRQLGVTIIYVTHDQEEALNLSDRIVVMGNGQVIQAGSPHDLYFRPRNDFVAGFLGECNFIPSGDGAPAAVRPENISVRPVGAPGPAIPAVVVEAIFLGPICKIILRSDGRDIVAHSAVDGFVASLAAGDAVTLSYRPEHVIAFG